MRDYFREIVEDLIRMAENEVMSQIKEKGYSIEQCKNVVVTPIYTAYEFAGGNILYVHSPVITYNNQRNKFELSIRLKWERQKDESDSGV